MSHRLHRFITPVLCALCVFVVNELSAQDFNFNHKQIQFSGQIQDIIIKDIDYDKQQEIIIQSGRGLFIYNPNSGKAQAIILSDDIFIYDIADITADTGLEVVGITPKGVVYLPMNTPGAKWSAIIETATIFSAKGGAVVTPVYQEFVSNGLISIPGNQGFILARLRQGSGGRARHSQSDGGQTEKQADSRFEIFRTLSMPARSDITYDETSVFVPLSNEISLPNINWVDVNADGRDDVVTISDNKLYYYLLGSDSSPISTTAKPDGYVKLGESRKKRDNAFYELIPFVKEMNGDGVVDIITADGGDGLITIYLNPQLKTELSKPTQIIRTNNWIVQYGLTDLNNDKLQDLTVVQMRKLGVLGGLEALLAHSVDWEIAVYLAVNRETGFYPQSPDYVKVFNVPFTFSLAGGVSNRKRSAIAAEFQTPYLWSLEGDYNKDGLNDLLISDAAGAKIQIYAGANKGVFNSAPAIELDIPSAAQGFKLIGMPVGEPFVADINNDGKDDIVIQTLDASPMEIGTPLRSAGKNHRLEVFTSR
ncbi:MAG: VCBS repeat-containing protein [Planctomycetes bacterium]|nr:VCBS repeat-containing protein [Planctomycetota bacterium]